MLSKIEDFKNPKTYDVCGNKIGNCVVFGMPGSGKSYLFKKKISSLYRQTNDRIYIVGDETEFNDFPNTNAHSEIINCLNGEYFTDDRINLIPTRRINLSDSQLRNDLLPVIIKCLIKKIEENSQRDINSYVFLSDFFTDSKNEELDYIIYNLIKDSHSLKCKIWIDYGEISSFFMFDEKTKEPFSPQNPMCSNAITRKKLLEIIDNYIILNEIPLSSRLCANVLHFNEDHKQLIPYLSGNRPGEGWLGTKNSSYSLYRIQR